MLKNKILNMKRLSGKLCMKVNSGCRLLKTQINASHLQSYKRKIDQVLAKDKVMSNGEYC